MIAMVQFLTRQVSTVSPPQKNDIVESFVSGEW